MRYTAFRNSQLVILFQCPVEDFLYSWSIHSGGDNINQPVVVLRNVAAFFLSAWSM